MGRVGTVTHTDPAYEGGNVYKHSYTSALCHEESLMHQLQQKENVRDLERTGS